MVPARSRPAWVEVDLGAVRANVEALAALVAPAALCVVVKADGYGHGAGEVARAALQGGADWLAVATVDEGVELRTEGVGAPILLLSQPPTEVFDAVWSHSLTPTLDTAAAVDAFDRIASRPTPVHLKVDTGMHRVGCPPSELPALASRVLRSTHLVLGGVWTHLACADHPDHPANSLQLRRYEAALADLATAGIDPGIRHAANSAAAISNPAARHDLVRCGIAVYGIAPSAEVTLPGLRPVLTVRARITHLTDLAAGEGVSYGHRFVATSPTRIATIPIGYADGIWRNADESEVEVLIGGRRHRIVGAVTMDQLMVDVGDHPVELGDEVVLIGTQGSDAITASEVAARVGTIPYEIVTRLSGRLPRRFSRVEERGGS